MKPLTTVRACAFLALATTCAVGQTGLDLSGWTAESYAAVSGFGAGSWNVAPGGDSVTQTVNGQPTFFISPFNAFNLQLEGQISSSGGSDDDYIGFALGFDPGESVNPAADYLLVDWKRANQSFNFGAPSCTPGTTAPRGLAVSRVSGIPTADEFWGHVNLNTAPCSTAADGLVELARGTNLGATGWNLNQVYTFKFTLTATSLQVFVDNVLEISVAGLFTNGRFAFYNFSQAAVTYSAYTSACAAAWSNYGFGSAGTMSVPGFSLSAPPVLGAPIDFLLTSANPAPCLAYVGYGVSPAYVPISGAATLWLNLDGILIFPIGPGVTPLPFLVPSDPALCGTSIYGQFVHEDPAGILGLAFSRGLEVVFGG